MLMVLLFISMTATTLFMSSHPVTILTMILTQTFLICISLWIMIKSSWFSFILFLIFLGGLMVLFVYVVSLASNEKFEMKMSLFYQMITLNSLMVLIVGVWNYFQVNNLLVDQTNMLMKTMMIFSSSNILTSILIMTYLLFTLLVAVKIASKYEGPLRKIN
uniref:NADH dehydrogenase subunit 6 n=1 Tax=Salina celebensis TaxID=1588069 RepID=A0A6G6A4Q1_9HEXA|nr:NADH dehydrogenase subunit 6 [Salina celebensis]QID03183.1 NADH dehydrogenase subunit 6 [Salina celebensis]